MSEVAFDLVADEFLRRNSNQFRLEDYCFKEQISFIRDESPFKTAVCSRRSGKTIACAADLIDTAITFPGTVSLYITLSRNNAKKIIWGEILEINRKFALGGVPNETELSLKLPNGSVIYCSGAKDKTEIEKFRGLALKKVYIDECQSFRPYIEALVEEVISKALFDYNGTLCLIGTPGPVPAGYFYDCAVSDQWSHHAWNMFNNPHLERKSGKKVWELVERDLKRKGVTVDHPSIQRECFGKWVVDSDALVFKYDSRRNHFTDLPSAQGAWSYIIGVDLGHDDADAIAVIGWNSRLKTCYLVEELIERKQGITELAIQLDAMIVKYNPDRIVMDTGGLGKKIAEEMRRRFSLPIVAAEKSRKMEYIELLNDALRTASFFARKESTFANDCMLVEWDKDNENPEKLIISDRYHSDICDAVLYGFRECLHWLSEIPIPPPPPETPAWYLKQEQEMEEAALRAMQQDTDPWEGLG